MRKTVVITGAGTGIGKALSEVFAKNGWNTIAQAHAALDVTDQKSIAAFVKKLDGQPVDVLINNAGVFYSPYEDPEHKSIDNIVKVFQVNTIGPKTVAEALLPNLHKGTEKLVVSISSVMGTYKSINEFSADHWPYGASKAALNFAMVSFGMEHPEIKSVLIHPGWVKTKMGGPGATLEPIESATNIYELIIDHHNRLPNMKMVRYTGELMNF